MDLFFFVLSFFRRGGFGRWKGERRTELDELRGDASLSPPLIGPSSGYVRGPHAPRIGESGVNKAARRRRRGLHISRRSDQHTAKPTLYAQGEGGRGPFF